MVSNITLKEKGLVKRIFNWKANIDKRKGRKVRDDGEGVRGGRGGGGGGKGGGDSERKEVGDGMVEQEKKRQRQAIARDRERKGG